MNSVLSAHKTFKLLAYKKMNGREEECEKIPIEYDKLCLQTFANVREKQRSLWRLHKRNSFQIKTTEMHVKGRTGRARLQK